MKKFLPHIFIAIFTAGVIFPNTAHAQLPYLDTLSSMAISYALQGFITDLADKALSLGSLISYISGWLLNSVVYITIVDISSGYEKIMAPVNVAWKTLRDLANMGFIFVLIYSAIQTILGSGSKYRETIVWVVIAAVLMNFSMFFTRIIIDLSNILALTFYDAIAPGAATKGMGSVGLSNAFMNNLGLTSLYRLPGAEAIDSSEIFTVGVVGTILLVVASFTFLAVAFMFAIRYVMLLIIITLSPVYFLSLAVPAGLKIGKYGSMWTETLIGQAFFAPIYFLLAWISMQIMSGLKTIIVDPSIANASLSGIIVGGPFQEKAFLLLFNYVISIILIIASLIIAKQWASQGGSGVGALVNKVSGWAGAATLGTTAWAGRNTIGRGLQAISESETLKRARENMIKRGGITGTVGAASIRLAQAATAKGGSASFDMRSGGPLSSALKDAGADKGQKGGYKAEKEARAKREAEYVKSQAPSEYAVATTEKMRAQASVDIARINARLSVAGLAEEERGRLKVDLKEAEKRKAEADNILGNKEEVDSSVKRSEESKKKEAEKITNDASEQLKRAEIEERSAQDTVLRLQAEALAVIGKAREKKDLEVEAAKIQLRKAREAASEIRKRIKSDIKSSNERFDTEISAIKETSIKSLADRRREQETEAIENSVVAQVLGYNYAAAAKIRKEGKKKGAKELFAEAIEASGEKKVDENKKGDEENKDKNP